MEREEKKRIYSRIGFSIGLESKRNRFPFPFSRVAGASKTLIGFRDACLNRDLIAGQKRKEEAKESRRLALRKAPGRRLDNRFGRGHYRRDLGADRWSAVNDPLHQGPLSILIAFIEASIFYLFRGFFVSASFPSLGRWSVPRKDWTDGQRRENLRLK
ncbi:hypothetical protein TNCV_2581721 [Trichonephila clavipes]|nr:hypothetical protein TNCV_2581721 [Trichonephila clavipes]